MKERKKRAAKQPSKLGKFLSRLPAGCPLLYPLYLATRLNLTKETYLNPALPEVFDGLTICYVSDIHFGEFLKQDRLDTLIQRANALEADVIVLGGDYGENAAGTLDFWQRKPAFRAKKAVLAIFGNHDRTLPDEAFPSIQNAMKAAGVLPLINDIYCLEANGKSLCFAGPDDFYNGEPDLVKLAHLSKHADFTIFLPHNPDILPETYKLPGGPFFHLALCGHTHGGQVTFFGWAPKPSSDYGNRYLSGWYREENADIFISNGVGTSDLPVRLGARPQFHLITLKKQ